jgi:hypothetical protein
MLRPGQIVRCGPVVVEEPDVRWTVEFEAEPHDVTVTTSEAATRQGFFEMLDELTCHPRWRPGMSVLLDHSALDAIPLDGLDIEAIAVRLNSLGSRFGNMLVAIVAPDAYTAGLAAVAIRFASPVEFSAQIFASHEEALAWLGEETARRAR